MHFHLSFLICCFFFYGIKRSFVLGFSVSFQMFYANDSGGGRQSQTATGNRRNVKSETEYLLTHILAFGKSNAASESQLAAVDIN